MKLYAVDIRVLQALRAGPMTSDQGAESPIPNFGATACRLMRAGLVHVIRLPRQKQGVIYSLTAAGLRACPPRNPASAKPRNLPRQGAHVHGPTGMAPGRQSVFGQAY